jgi:hypothetical protein
MLLLHHAIPALMHGGLDPTGCPLPAHCGSSAARLPAAGRPFPPEHLARAVAEAIAEILQQLLPTRRLRAFPRVVKRNMSSFGVTRRHWHWPQPTIPAATGVMVVGAYRPAPVKRRAATPGSPPDP